MYFSRVEFEKCFIYNVYVDQVSKPAADNEIWIPPVCRACKVRNPNLQKVRKAFCETLKERTGIHLPLQELVHHSLLCTQL